MFITFEGIDGCGKSTQLRLLAEHLASQGTEVISTREPGGTPLSEEMRGLLLQARADGEDISPRAELLLFAAARAQHVQALIRPALDRGAWVLCDRFTDSTLAYQSGALGLDEGWARDLNRFATDGLEPRVTLLFDVPVEVALERRAQVLGGADRIESRGREFQERVRQAFLDLAAREPSRIFVIDASESAPSVHQQTLQVLEDRRVMP